MSLDINKTAELLRKEEEVLQYILFRNKNQHRKTKVFSYLQRVKKCLKDIDIPALCILFQENEKIIRLLDGKVGLSELKNLVDGLSSTSTFLHELCECSRYSAMVSTYIGPQLAQRVFVPLYTVFLALVSKVYRLLTDFIVPLYGQFLALKDKVNHVLFKSSNNVTFVKIVLPVLQAPQSSDSTPQLKMLVPPRDVRLIEVLRELILGPQMATTTDPEPLTDVHTSSSIGKKRSLPVTNTIDEDFGEIIGM